MSALAVSVLLSLVSAVAYAAGAIVQEQVAMSSPDGQYAPLRRPGWWAAVALNGTGGLLHVVALAFGPLSLVQPLGALTIVFALPMAALFVGRKAGATAWRGAIMATVGLAGLLSLVGTSDAQSLDTAQRVFVAVVTAGAVIALMVAGRAAHRHPAVRSMLLATASGIAFGMSSVFTKTVAVDWTGGVSVADIPSLAVIGVLATAGMLLSQASYRGAGLAAPLAMLTVVNPVVAAAVGITMFEETFRHGTMGTVLALGCGVVAAGGLILLTTERIARTHAEETAASSLPGPATAESVPAGELVEELAEELLARLPEQQIAVLRESVLVPSLTAAPEDVLVPAPTAAPEDVVLARTAADVVLARTAAAQDVVLAPAAAAESVTAPDGVIIPASTAQDGDHETPEPSSHPEAALNLYGPFYGGPYVPLPVLHRRRTRVTS
ncbi:drug/metabolite transporter (DMT)-like permease [Streptomyces sp. LBL]|uniref:DMT family transporter n=1 Tax=Streptomyces sp. LBL TaxID=2940562 RepID=UPI002475623D|nr:DMT family transporter [Streptomyces sp. LBL]MDH6627811.1 drug/metabolite transporter (DMT)-like permease [Streptomyces sp. LBL]